MPRKKIEDPELTPAAEEIAGGDILMETDIPPEETESDEYTAPAYESEDGESPPAAETGDTGGDGPTDAEAEEPAPIEVLVPADDPPLEENLQGGETAPGDSMPLGDPVQEPAPSERVEKPTPRASRKKKPPGVESVPAEVPPETPKPGATSRRRTSAPPVLTVEAHDEVETQADREDVVWHEIHNAYRTRKILTGVLGGIEQLENHKTLVIVYYKEFRIAIPMSEMMLNIAGTEGQNYDELMRRQNKLLNNMLGAEIDFMVKGIDAKARSVVASRKDAMLKKRRTFYMDTDASGTYRIYEGRIVQARVIAVSERVIRVDVFGVECSIRAPELSWDWMGDARDQYSVGDQILVRVTNVYRDSPEDITIKADVRSVSSGADRENLKKCRVQGKYAGKVTDIHKGIVFVRLAIGVNAVAHSCYDNRMPGKKDDVSFAVTRIDEERNVAVGIITRIIKQNL